MFWKNLDNTTFETKVSYYAEYGTFLHDQMCHIKGGEQQFYGHTWRMLTRRATILTGSVDALFAVYIHITTLPTRMIGGVRRVCIFCSFAWLAIMESASHDKYIEVLSSSYCIWKDITSVGWVLKLAPNPRWLSRWYFKFLTMVLKFFK